ncbi:hypothetical protein [Bacillus sp. FSL W8-0629]|uniref:hypothetical protein n=1 Tax=Bacillus sp. FSL W8-0629 TaxID=2954626 RepID=UPI0031597D8A
MSNENQYIEAARIAAETASRNTQLTMIIAIVSALIALLGVGLTAWITYKNASRNAIVDALVKQRIEWLNNLREKFVEFNTLTNEIYLDVNRRKITGTGSDNLLDKYHLLEKTKTHIRLLLNPQEVSANTLNELSQELVMLLFEGENIDIEVLTDILRSVDVNQQTILKSEWKRIKEEIKQGRELNSFEVFAIYTNTFSEMMQLLVIKREE